MDGKYASVTEGKSNFVNLTGGATVFSRANFGTAQNYERIIDFGNGSPADNILFYREGTDDTLGLAVYNGSGGSSHRISSGVINSEWRSYAGTVAINGASSIYRNGSSIGTATINTPTNATRSNLYIGESNWGNDSQAVEMS